jgi:hypothetical protein
MSRWENICKPELLFRVDIALNHIDTRVNLSRHESCRMVCRPKMIMKIKNKHYQIPIPTPIPVTTHEFLITDTWMVLNKRRYRSNTWVVYPLLENHDQINKKSTDLCWFGHYNDRFHWICNFLQKPTIWCLLFVNLSSTITKSTKF